MEVQAVNSSEITLEIFKSTNDLFEKHGGLIELITFIRNNKVCKKHIESKKIYLKIYNLLIGGKNRIIKKCNTFGFLFSKILTVNFKNSSLKFSGRNRPDILNFPQKTKI